MSSGVLGVLEDTGTGVLGVLRTGRTDRTGVLLNAGHHRTPRTVAQHVSSGVLECPPGVLAVTFFQVPQYCIEGSVWQFLIRIYASEEQRNSEILNINDDIGGIDFF